MTPDQNALRHITRRHFFADCRVGLGSLALASLLNEGRPFAAALEVVDDPEQVLPALVQARGDRG